MTLLFSSIIELSILDTNGSITSWNQTNVAFRCWYLQVVICFHIHHLCQSAVDISSGPLVPRGTTPAYSPPFRRPQIGAVAGPRAGVARPCWLPFFWMYPYKIQKSQALWGRCRKHVWPKPFCSRKHSCHEQLGIRSGATNDGQLYCPPLTRPSC